MSASDGESRFDVLRGRWYGRRTTGELDAERYLDVNEELLFQAVQFHRGGPGFRAQQSVLSIERLEPSGDGFEVDFRILKLILDGADRTSEFLDVTIRGRCRVSADALELVLAEPGGPRPKDLSESWRFDRRR